MRHSIKQKILIYFSAAALFTMILLGMVVTWQLNRSFSRQAEELTANLTTQIYNNLDYPHQTFSVRLRNDIRRVADNARQMPEVRQTPGPATEFANSHLLALPAALQRISQKERLDFSALFDLNGRLQASFPVELQNQNVEEVLRLSEFGSLPERIRQGQTEGAEIWESLSLLDVPTLKTFRLYSPDMPAQGMIWMAAVSIVKDDIDNPIGFCLVGRLLPHYEDILTELYNTGGYAGVLYSGNTPVAQAGFGSLGTEAFDFETLSLPQDTAADIMQTQAKTLDILLLAGQEYLMTCAPLRSSENVSIGSLCIGLPQSRVSETQQTLLAQGERTRQQILTSMAQIGLLSVAVFILLSLLIATNIVRPIQELSHTSRQIADGDLKQQIPLTSHDEIGELILAFNDMTIKLSNKERTVEQQTAELSATNDQLNDALNNNLELLKQSHLSEQLLRNVLDNSPELIFAKDKDFRYILVNRRYAETLGMTVDDMLGKEDLEIGAQGLRADDAAVLAGEPVHHVNEIITDASGVQRVFETHKIPLRGDNDEIFAVLGVSHDVTEQRQVNQKLEEASQHKSDFLSNMSHELRTPLNAIIGFTSITITALKGRVPEEHLKNLKKSESAARTLMQLISDVLDLSKIEAGEMQTHIEEIYLEDLLDDVAITAEGLLLDKAITFVCDYPDDMPPVQNDYVKMKQILTNLISNAVKFTTAGGVAVKASTLNHPSANWGIHIEVQDTGCGVPEDKLSTIFESFKQVDGSISKKFGGTGLGLAITKNFCDSLGITIDVWSEVGRGTTFGLNIPADYHSVSEQPGSQPAPLPSFEFQTLFPKIDRKAVILCLASTELCAAVQHHLSRVPLEVQQVSDMQECLEYAEQAFIWTVLVEPGSDGFENAIRLKEDPAFAQIPVILCSLGGEHVGMQQLGPLEHLTKPVEEQQLLDVLFRITKKQAGEVLVVEDDDNLRDLYSQILTKSGYTPKVAADGLEALQELGRSDLPQAMILDLLMPNMDGFQVLEHMQVNAAWRRIPIIVVTGKSLSAPERQRIQDGAAMLLQKDSLTVEELPRRIAASVHAVMLAGNPSILVVDDNQMNLDLEAGVFRNAGYTVYTAKSGDDAIQFAADTLPDIILMDLGMPGMDGFEATQRIKQQAATSAIIVIACSAFATKEHQLRALTVGCEGYITKPVEPNRMVEQVTTYFLTAKIRQRMTKNNAD